MSTHDPKNGFEPVAKPAAKFDHRSVTAFGLNLDVHSDQKLTGAWLSLPGSDVNLSVVANAYDFSEEHCVQYCDGKSMFPRFALAVNANAKATACILLHGEGPEHRRLRMVSLERVMDLVEKYGASDEPV